MATDAAEPSGEGLRFALFVAGTPLEISQSEANLRRLLDARLAGGYSLETIDVARHPARAEREKITTTPTVLLNTPGNLRRLIGNPSSPGDLDQLLGTRPTSHGIASAEGSGSRPAIAEGSTGQRPPDSQSAGPDDTSAGPSRAERRIEELEKALARERKVSRSLGDFAHKFAHDAKEPLFTIERFSGFLLEDHARLLPPEGQKDLRRIHDAGQRLTALLNDTLSFAKTGAERMDLGTVDLNTVLKWVVADLDAMLSASGGICEVSRLPKALGNENALYQLFLILIGNALKFRRADTAPVIRVFAAPPREGEKPRLIEISVTDNGIGFDQSFAHEIFEPFTRLVSHHVTAGSGLGLATARTIVERHGGDISATGQPARGAVFTLTLQPASQAH